MKPLSRGKVSITDKAPTVPPLIEPGLFTDPEEKDLAMLRDGLRIAEELASAAATSALATIMGSADDARSVVGGHGKVHGLADAFDAFDA
jgi:choline dehydrogenase-like flavoprotein